MATSRKSKNLKFDQRHFATSPLSQVMPGLMQTLGIAAEAKKSVSMIRLINQWASIVGQDFAQRCTPLKIIYRKQKCRKTGDISTVSLLRLQCDNALGTVLAMREAIIVDRLNRLFGTSQFTGIQIEHGYTPASPAPQKRSEPRHFELNLPDIDDPVLKSRLESLGQAVMNSAQNNKG